MSCDIGWVFVFLLISGISYGIYDFSMFCLPFIVCTHAPAHAKSVESKFMRHALTQTTTTNSRCRSFALTRAHTQSQWRQKKSR